MHQAPQLLTHPAEAPHTGLADDGGGRTPDALAGTIPIHTLWVAGRTHTLAARDAPGRGTPDR
jgi:hypothetical protein